MIGSRRWSRTGRDGFGVSQPVGAGRPACVTTRSVLLRGLRTTALLSMLAMSAGCRILTCSPMNEQKGPDDYIGSLYYERILLKHGDGRLEDRYHYIFFDEIRDLLNDQWVGWTFHSLQEFQNFEKQYYLNCYESLNEVPQASRSPQADPAMTGSPVCIYHGRRDMPQIFYSKCMYDTVGMAINFKNESYHTYTISDVNVFQYPDNQSMYSI